MEKWRGKTAVVTGASSGIGEALARRLAASGLRVLGLARREHRLKNLEDDLNNAGFTMKCLQCDIASEEDVQKAFSWIEENWGQVDILINNAGIFPYCKITDEEFYEQTKKAFDVNVLGTISCTKLAIESMKRHGVTQGHIINVNSVAGHRVIDADGFIPYCASKNALKVISTMLQGELGRAASGIRVTNISPGLTKSEMGDNYQTLFGKKGIILETEDIVDGIEYCLAAPCRVNISELTIQSQAAQVIKQNMINGSHNKE